MEIQAPAKLLLVYIDETDTWSEARVPLYEAIVQMLFDHKIAGATVHSGVVGFGVARRLHKRRLFGVTDKKPLTISVVENEQKLRQLLPRLKTMVREGLIVLVDAEVLHHGRGDSDSGGVRPE